MAAYGPAIVHDDEWLIESLKVESELSSRLDKAKAERRKKLLLIKLELSSH